MTAPRARGPIAPGDRGAGSGQLRSGFRRSIALTALGTVVPGAGLTLTRRRRLGWVVLTIALLSLAALLFVVITSGVTRTALSVVSRPETLREISIALVVAGVLWCGSIVLTAIEARPDRLDRPRSRLLAGFTTLMVAVVATSSFKGAEYAVITRDTVVQVFGTTPTTNWAGGAHVAAGEDPWAQTPRVNILLIGSDAGKGRAGTRTDSMIVASIDTRTGHTVLVQLPRNLEKAPLAPHSPLRERYPSGAFGEPNSACAQGSHTCFLGNLWREAEMYRADHPGSYPGNDHPGRTENRATIQLITGLRIDHEVVVDLVGFEQLIDAMGGLDLTVKLSGYGAKLPIGGSVNEVTGRIEGITGYLEPGRQHLDGYRALWYARTRAADDDTFRQARQRCVVQAIVQQVNPAAMVRRYPDLARIAKDNIYTDIPAAHLPAYVDLVERVQKATLTSLALTPQVGILGADPDYARIRKLVQEAITPRPSVTSAPQPTTRQPSTPPSTTPEPTTPKPGAIPPTQPYDTC